MGALPSIRMRHLAGRPYGPVLVLGPSLGTAVDRLWGPVADLLKDWNILGWDLPGHGRSPQADRLTDGFDLAELAAGVAQLVDEHVDGNLGFAYAGDSVGGAVGLQLALDRPDRVTSLTVLCTAAKLGEPAAWHDRAALVRAEGMGPMVLSSPSRWFGPAILAAADGRTDAALADLDAVDPEGYARTCEAIGSYDVRARLGAVKVPVLAIAGSDDVATPPAMLADIARGVKNGRLEVLDGVGHLAPYEAPTEVATLLHAHLSAGTVG